MNIIIPIGGKGLRFSRNGFVEPKPLIKIFEKYMIEYVLDNLNIYNNDKIFIIYNKNLDNYNFTNIINNKYKSKYNNLNLININDTSGAVETLYLGITHIFDNLEYHTKSIILDCDTFYTFDILTIFRNSFDNMVFYTKNFCVDPIYSYIQLNNDSNIISIKEKQKISDNANTGAYAFIDIKILYQYCKYVLDNNITFNNEPFTSCVISVMLTDNILFKGIKLDDKCVISLGTPTAVQTYINNTYAFLFDLDGTLVITDDIYFKVWKEICYNYNIVLTMELFKTYIQGNNDKYVLQSLLYNININLNDLSNLKDTLFIQHITDILIIDGVYDILKYIKLLGHKCCIVTNCNKIVASAIIKKINIEHLIDFIISNNDCVNAKPNKEPYENAINKYNISNTKCFIFEDSKSGILSAKSVNPKLLIGLETNYNSDELKHYGTDLSIKNYIHFNIDNLLAFDSILSQQFNITKLITENLNNHNIDTILIDNIKLKGGFISDVISFKIQTNNDVSHSYIFKYENTEINNLSLMAQQLQLYEREYYFYTNISKYVNIKIPNFVSLVKNDNFDNCGIILENLFDKHFKLNLNLNIESIDISLKIVDNMAKMHSKFWNKNLNKMFPSLKKTDDTIFNPFLTNFISTKIELFKSKWKCILNDFQLLKCDEIFQNFSHIQKRFSNGDNLTFIHGDIKSPNIFYDVSNNYEPYFIDWQHCAVGKGVQDLIFFIIESFDITNINLVYTLFKSYYYKKIIEYGVKNYSFNDYENDILDALYYVPFFTAIWFGSTPNDELIDNNFPYFFINKLFYLIEIITIAS